MLHKGQYVNISRKEKFTFNFSAPPDRWKSDFWKGWYKQARKAEPRIPNLWEHSGEAEEFIISHEPEVSSLFIIYRMVSRSDMYDTGVLVLSRRTT